MLSPFCTASSFLPSAQAMVRVQRFLQSLEPPQQQQETQQEGISSSSGSPSSLSSPSATAAEAAEAATPPLEAFPSTPQPPPLGGGTLPGTGSAAKPAAALAASPGEPSSLGHAAASSSSSSPGELPLLPPGEMSLLGHTAASPAGEISVLGQSALRRWSRAHDQWQRQVAELQAACGAAVEAVRESALWHCEVVAGPSWELTHSKAYFDNLHRCGGYKCGGEGGHRRGIGGLA